VLVVGRWSSFIIYLYLYTHIYIYIYIIYLVLFFFFYDIFLILLYNIYVYILPPAALRGRCAAVNIGVARCARRLNTVFVCVFPVWVPLRAPVGRFV